MTSNTLSNFRK